MKRSFLILSLLALTFIACPPPEPEPQPEPEKPTLSKIDITDAAALFVEPSGTDAGKIFKIKKDLTTIEEVKYTNTDGSSADMGNLKASYVINAHNDYAIIGFAADPNKAKTYDFELVADKAYLVRKSDGKVFSLDEYGFPSCRQIMPFNEYIYFPSGKIINDNNFYSYGEKLVKIDTSDLSLSQDNILPKTVVRISRFFIDKNQNIWYFKTKDSISSSLITSNGKDIEIQVSISLNQFSFGYISPSPMFLDFFDNSKNSLEEIMIANAEENSFSEEEYRTMSKSPLAIYESNNNNLTIYNNFFLLRTKEENNGITLKKITHSLHDFSADQNVFPCASQNNVYIVGSIPDQPNDSVIISVDMVSHQTNNIYVENYKIDSIFSAENKIYFSGTVNGVNIIRSLDGSIIITEKTTTVSTADKIIITDMSNLLWIPLPYND